jgi:hypothetical protein
MEAGSKDMSYKEGSAGLEYRHSHREDVDTWAVQALIDGQDRKVVLKERQAHITKDTGMMKVRQLSSFVSFPNHC